jgi:hypothetical protein
VTDADEEPRVAPVALQTVGEGVGARLAAVIVEGGAPGRVACAGQEGAAHGQARHAAEVTDDLGEVDVHCGEGLVPGLDAGGRGADAGIARAPGGPSHTEVLGGTASAGAQPDGVECLAPLAVGAIGVAAGQVVGVAGGDPVDGTTARVQDVEAGDPVHPRAVHDHGLEVAGVEPVGHGLAVGRHASTPAHGRWRAIRGHGDVVRGTAHLAPGGMAMQRRQSSGRIRRPWACRLFCAGVGPRRPCGVRRVTCQGAVRPGCGAGCASLTRGRGLHHRRMKRLPPHTSPPGPRSHANQRASKAPRKRRPSLAAPRRRPRCHHAPEAPSVFHTSQHRRVLCKLTKACS